MSCAVGGKGGFEIRPCDQLPGGAFTDDRERSPTTAIPSDTDFSLLLTYADARKVVEYWQRKGVRESRIRKIAIENYARVLQQTLQTR